jgi:hypothetical protein
MTVERVPAVAPEAQSAIPPGERLSSLASLAALDDVDPEVAEVLIRLEEALIEQAARTEALANKVERLEAQRALLAHAVAGGPGSGEAAAENGTEAEAEEETESPRSFFGRRRDPVSVDRLVEAGMRPSEASEIVAAVDQIAYDRMKLRFEATRDGTLNSAEYRKALADIPDVRQFVQEEYGDDAYDKYLYASGRPNRVIVTDVLQESPAQQLGLEAGDVLVALNDQRIYSSRDIMAIASESNGSVPLTVRRGDQILRYYVEPGPLGVRSRWGFENPDPDGG